MEEKNFKYFLELPAKHRMAIIDAMKPDDRVRFTRTSKITGTEAKSSKNYLEFLGFKYHSENELKISIKYGGYDYFKAKNDMVLDIKKEEDNKKYMKCIKLGGEELWSIELEDRTNLVDFAVECFKNLLQLHQGHIKRLHLEAAYYRNGVNFDIGDICFERLEHLKILGEYDSLPFINRTCRPLKTLDIIREGTFEYPMEKIYAVQDTLVVNLKLNNSQFSRLSASTVVMDIGDITEDCIFNFVRSWQNGTVGRKLKWFQLDLPGSNFDIKRLFRLLGDNKYNSKGFRYELIVPHHKDAGKKARILRLSSSLQLHFPDDQEKKNLFA